MLVPWWCRAAHVWVLWLVHEVVIKFCDIILYKVVLATNAFVRCFTVLVHRTLQERRVCMFTPGGGVRKVTARARLAWRGGSALRGPYPEFRLVG